MELNKIYHMDAFEGLKLIPDKSVNLAILDPPYNIGVITMRDNRPQKMLGIRLQIIKNG